MFQRARLILTTQYLCIIMLISLSFSLAIYNVVTGEVDRVSQAQRLRLERRFEVIGLPPPANITIDQDLVNEVHQRVFVFLLFINSGVFLASGALGFLLAGRTLKPIQEMIDEQNRFISDSSHELRTPLTSLKSAMEVALRDKKITLKEVKSLISENIHDVDKLQSLSDQLLQLSQFEKPNSHTKFEPTSLLQVSKEAVTRVSKIAIQKKLEIINHIKDIDIIANKFNLIDLFVILLDNAVKYSPIHSQITLNSKVIDDHVNISVADRGVGIAKEDLPHIFDRFYRADSARSRSDVGGYGLGLSIAKKIVESHHGSINVKSEVDIGTTFIVKLPYNRSAPLKPQAISSPHL